MFVLLWMLGCTCNETEPPMIAPRASHFGTFHGLVNAATQGDVDGAKWIARSLQEGDVPEPLDDGGGLEEVGGALGFIQIAEDAEEVVDGLATAAVGCGKCHVAAGVKKPEMGVWTHESAGLRLVLGAVFPPGEAPPAEGDELVPVSLAWDSAEASEGENLDVVRLTAALGACLECHEATIAK